MTKRKNEYGVKALIMSPFFVIVHPTTQAKLQLKTTVEFFPGQFLPEFTEVQNTIRQKLDNQKMPVEEATDRLTGIFMEYCPEELKIRVDVINNTAFFTVSVLAEASLKKDETEEKKGKEGQENSEE